MKICNNVEKPPTIRGMRMTWLDLANVTRFNHVVILYFFELSFEARRPKASGSHRHCAPRTHRRHQGITPKRILPRLVTYFNYSRHVKQLRIPLPHHTL